MTLAQSPDWFETQTAELGVSSDGKGTRLMIVMRAAIPMQGPVVVGHGWDSREEAEELVRQIQTLMEQAWPRSE